MKSLFSPAQTQNIQDYNFAYLLHRTEDHVLHLTLNRPQKKNAFNEVLSNELAYAIYHAKYNKDIWAVVVDAVGDIFCAGADLLTFRGIKDENSGSTVPLASGAVVFGDVFGSLHKPCIAKVNAPVYAGGFLFLCGCTHVVATPNARFALPEVKRGLFPFQVMESLLGVMPARKVLDLCIMGKTFGQEEGFELGLVTDKAESDTLDAVVGEMLDRIRSHSPSAIRFGLQAYQEIQGLPKDERHGHLHTMLMEVVNTEDAKEGIAAFKEKRKPEWKGK